MAPDTKYYDATEAFGRYMIEYGILERDGDSFYWVSVTLNHQIKRSELLKQQLNRASHQLHYAEE